jgi:hypothetical protein
MLRLFLILAFCLWHIALPAQKKRFAMPAELPEVSGLHIAAPDSLWWHNDSGGSPVLFLTDANGRLLAETTVPNAQNKDWEDITADDRGRLYIGDFGNNANKRKDLRIYIFAPASGTTDSIRFRYPDQQAFPPAPEQAAFDMEAFFWWNDTLHLFSKNRLLKGNYLSRHYTLPALPGEYVATLTDSIYLHKRVVTGAAIRADGGQVAMLSYFYKRILGFIPKIRTTVFLWDDFPSGQYLQGRRQEIKVRRCILPAQYEAIDYWDANTLLIASEKVPLSRAHARRVKIAGRTRPVAP